MGPPTGVPEAHSSESAAAVSQAVVPVRQACGGGTGTSPPIARRPDHGPLRPLRYELCRVFGVRAPLLIAGTVLIISAALAVLLGRTGRTPLPQLLAAWPQALPLPPAALGAGLLGALGLGDEYRYPALAARQGTRAPPSRPARSETRGVGRNGSLYCADRLRRLTSGPCASCTAESWPGFPSDWPHLVVSWSGLTVGCAWAGLLGAGVFRSTTAGLAAVLAVPVAVVPLVQGLLAGPAVRSIAGFPASLSELAWVEWPPEVDRWADGCASSAGPTRRSGARIVALGFALRISVHRPWREGPLVSDLDLLRGGLCTTPGECPDSFR